MSMSFGFDKYDDADNLLPGDRKLSQELYPDITEFVAQWSDTKTHFSFFDQQASAESRREVDEALVSLNRVHSIWKKAISMHESGFDFSYSCGVKCGFAEQINRLRKVIDTTKRQQAEERESMIRALYEQRSEAARRDVKPDPSRLMDLTQFDPEITRSLIETTAGPVRARWETERAVMTKRLEAQRLVLEAQLNKFKETEVAEHKQHTDHVARLMAKLDAASTALGTNQQQKQNLESMRKKTHQVH